MFLLPRKTSHHPAPDRLLQDLAQVPPSLCAAGQYSCSSQFLAPTADTPYPTPKSISLLFT